METVVGTKPTRAAFTIFYNQGTQKYELEQTLQPDEQMWIDVGKLIREHVPDKNGNVLPSELTSGSYDFRDLTNKGAGTLFEGKVIYDKTYGHAAYGCGGCCGYGAAGTTVFFDPLALSLGFTAGDGVDGWNGCTGLYDDVSDSFYGTWSAANTAIATVDYYATHTGHGVGSTTSQAHALLASNFLRCPLQERKPGGGVNVQQVSQSPSLLNMSTGDTKQITVSVSPNNITVSTSFTIIMTSNADSCCSTSLTIPGASGQGSITSNVTATASAQSPSGVFSATASAGGVQSSNSTTVQVPPQVLIQMMQAEAGGTGNSTLMQGLGDVAQNRIHSSIFNPPYTNYQNTVVSGQFALTTTTTTGIEPELDAAANTFIGTSGRFCNALAFWTSTATQWQTVQTAINSGTTTFPAGTGAPTFSSWSTQNQQILYVSSVGTQSNGAPNFLFLAYRSSTQPAAVNASCTP